ncbi:four helix bundle protein [Alcanivorax jadensis]|jgi:four helix bundle protein|uniref:four helix bundle protein n=1 Tax=Alcanivorax jadensis TaxID=64988 RepID=UPI000C68FAED|nr:four helix bundle protein [Alcanivorax jadensis]MBG33078.1 hypothetical protein [Alcanivorax sp.]MDF1636017.1 four helix bundle protein [Alcanivorax jadensis]|tara:strand:- start:548 stop:946 length:399 start_codon:yes stop_codon:yes gene_type:complete
MQARNTEKIRGEKVERENRRYRNLRVWLGAVELAKAVYGMTKGWPREKRSGLAGQMQKAALGIPSNIAQGYGRGGDVEFCRFLRIARGSLFELEAQLIVVERLGYSGKEELNPMIEKVFGLMSGVLRKLEAA